MADQNQMKGGSLRMLEQNQEFTHKPPSHEESKLGSFKSITTGIFAVYNGAGDLLYTMESLKKVDSGYVLFAEFEDYHTVENVAIDIKLIEAPKSVIDAQVVVPPVDQ